MAVSISSPGTGADIQPAVSGSAVRVWLWFCAALVFAMIVVGGATRLTDSGLSITEWQPLLGAIPPLNDADWHTAFEKYKGIPQYSVMNAGMSLEDFKAIYWWEWAHRFLGRFIGLAFGLPFLFFWLSGRVRGGFALKCLGVFALGGLQGFIGWYMVKSGLVDRVDVSQYRLTLHLITAFAILSLLVWLALSAAPEGERIRFLNVTPAQRLTAIALFVLIFFQSALGALVAGLNAGLTYNTWPLMDGRIVPDGLFMQHPWYINFFENITTVQFDHRMVAYAVVTLGLIHFVTLVRSADDERIVRSGALLAICLLAQMLLGIWTLLAVVPLSLGLAHQGGAAIVIAVATLHLHRIASASKA
ncbi:COX15/CtaA family protein [Hyphomicrobium sulfonivorans]|uniref:COX15/CtaA family protein n=1 Tax=Hyphomicrobium sulfonivorans TaxID=121290 RepID=UPI001FE9EA2F|nr:COX15/CtaA family protein [Hyphomicrobium sulfonivorans]